MLEPLAQAEILFSKQITKSPVTPRSAVWRESTCLVNLSQLHVPGSLPASPEVAFVAVGCLDIYRNSPKRGPESSAAVTAYIHVCGSNHIFCIMLVKSFKLHQSVLLSGKTGIIPYPHNQRITMRINYIRMWMTNSYNSAYFMLVTMLNGLVRVPNLILSDVGTCGPLCR